jgi:CheY-like chemotaxis protein
MPKKATILVVDDEEAALQLMHDALVAAGYEVHAAPDGQAAWKALQSGAVSEPALLLTDLVMPRMDGMELARKVVEAHPRVRILFTSGYADDVVCSHQDIAAASAFLPKPFDVPQLLKRVKEVVGR